MLFNLARGAWAFVHDDARHQHAAAESDDQQTQHGSNAGEKGRCVERHRVPPLWRRSEHRPETLRSEPAVLHHAKRAWPL
jgi:hypothetical protein